MPSPGLAPISRKERPMKRLTVLLIVPGLMLSACVNTPPSPAELLTPAPPTGARLDFAEAQWLALNVHDYRIQVQTISLWHLQTHNLVVRNGEAVESSATCEPAPLEFGNECKVQPFEAADF